MTDPLDEATYNSAIARLYRGDQVIGTAFLVADRYLLTCAHVVTLALGLSVTPLEAPSQSLEVDFLCVENVCAENPTRYSAPSDSTLAGL